MANVSHRLGKQSPPDAIRSASQASRELSDAFDRCQGYLRENGIDLSTTAAKLGPWVTYDFRQQRFIQEFAEAANALSERPYRAPFVVPKIA